MRKIFFFAALLVAAFFSNSCKGDGDSDSEVLAVILDKTTLELVKGESYQLNARVVPENKDAQIEWFSEDESYVTVDQDGLVTAVALKKDSDIEENEEDDDENAQAVSIFARYEGGAAECEVIVLPLEPEALSLVPSQKVMKVGEQLLMTVEYEPADVDIKDVEWETTMASVATVKDGVVTAKGFGTCEIIVKYGRIEGRAEILVL